jgi:hypothetical protein
MAITTYTYAYTVYIDAGQSTVSTYSVLINDAYDKYCSRKLTEIQN